MQKFLDLLNENNPELYSMSRADVHARELYSIVLKQHEDGSRVGRLLEFKEKVYPPNAHLNPDYTQLRHQSCTVHYTDNLATSPKIDELFGEVENITAILRGKNAN